MIPTFRSRLGLWCLRLGVLVPVVLLMGFVVFELAGCTLGFTKPGTCRHLPAELGDLALSAGVLGIYAVMFFSPAMLLIGLTAEWRARRR